jgi:hypothetical protein
VLQPGSITRAVGPAVAAALLVVASAAGRPAQDAPRDGLTEALRPIQGWREAPAYAALFAPPAQRQAYRAFVLPLELAQVLRALEDGSALVRAPGAWRAKAVLPWDALGQSGPYDRWKVARLYGSRRASVARGPRQQDGDVVESWTLISPYPDQDLSRLLPGTLLIVLRLP